MRTLVMAVALLGLVVTAGSALAEIGVIDRVPAATLLLPHFEVDINNPSGIATLMSINNASASAAVAHVTLWTDQGIPTLVFDVYLTGYDVQTINLRDIFNGQLPVTADAGADTGDSISNQGDISQDVNFGPVSPDPPVGACDTATRYDNSPMPAATLAHLRAAHTGQPSAAFGGLCSGAKYLDGIARGYITVDSARQCTLSSPASPGYFTGNVNTGDADYRNILWGDYFHVTPAGDFAQGDTLVHIEACVPGNGYSGYVGNGAGHCPFGAGAYTFYGRYVGAAASDQREPLATTFATRYLNGGAFNGGTDLMVWRDTKLPPTGTAGPYDCAQAGPAGWFPLAQTDVVAFDEQENATDQCALATNTSPVTGGAKTCFPLASQRIHTQGGNTVASDMTLPAFFGWLYLNLNHSLAADPYPGVAQAWVSTIMEAQARFSVGFNAIQLDSALSVVGGGTVLLP